jgi:hypothetical protein
MRNELPRPEGWVVDLWSDYTDERALFCVQLKNATKDGTLNIWYGIAPDARQT